MVQSSSSASDHHPNLPGHLETFPALHPQPPEVQNLLRAVWRKISWFQIHEGVFFYNPSLFGGLYFSVTWAMIISQGSIPFFSQGEAHCFWKNSSHPPTWSSQSNGSKRRLLVHPSRRPGLDIFRTNRGCFLWRLKRLNTCRVWGLMLRLQKDWFAKQNKER